jgi:uncharacterized protein DUF4838
MARVRLAALQAAAIHTAGDIAPPVQYAAAELQRYWRQLTGLQLPIVSASAARSPALAIRAPGSQAGTPAPPRSGGFSIFADEDGIVLTADSPRALLDAVYALLEQCGCRWSVHGPHEEVVPRLSATELDISSLTAAPRFAVRGYCTDIMTWHYTQPEHFTARLDDDRAFIDWMGKSGANAFFFIRHPFDTQLTIPELLPEFERRGIAVEYGGHVMPLLLPRELFREHPEYFPESPAGARTDHGNLCTSNAGALVAASANAVRYVHDHPEMSVVHIWGADLWQGGWCHCTACRDVSVQDQSLRVCNAVARALAEAGTMRPVCYLAYHDTIEPALTVAADEHVVVEFAPRERCYGHALNDPDCDTNRRYAAALEGYVDRFDGRVRLFEYYGDAILFFGCVVPLTEVIAADLDYYKRLGVGSITMLQFGTFSLWAYPLNFLAFAAGSVGMPGPRRCAGAYSVRFGAHAAAAEAVFGELESIMQSVVTYGDIRRPPRTPESAARVDAAIAAAVPRLAAIARRLDDLDSDALAAQGALVRYTETVLRGVRGQLQNGAITDEHYDEALRIVDGVATRFKGLWGSVDLPIIHTFFNAAGYVE